MNNQIEYIPPIKALDSIKNSELVDCLSYIDPKFENESKAIQNKVKLLIEESTPTELARKCGV